jgi:alpha-tubulin suppressor-like RCC1 family protein
VVDEYGRIWTFGDNKHGSLGRSIRSAVASNSSTSTGADVNASMNPSSNRSGRNSSRVSTKDSELKQVTGLEAGVRWQRVSVLF